MLAVTLKAPPLFPLLPIIKFKWIWLLAFKGWTSIIKCGITQKSKKTSLISIITILEATFKKKDWLSVFKHKSRPLFILWFLLIWFYRDKIILRFKQRIALYHWLWYWNNSIVILRINHHYFSIYRMRISYSSASNIELFTFGNRCKSPRNFSCCSIYNSWVLYYYNYRFVLNIYTASLFQWNAIFYNCSINLKYISTNVWKFHY